MPAWRTIAGADGHFSFRIPDPTPGGQAITQDRDEREGIHRIHVSSGDRFELYFEVVSNPGKFSHRHAYDQMKEDLAKRFPDLRITEMYETTKRSLPASEFEFEWGDSKRHVVLMDTLAATYRVIFNPKSPLNEQVFDTLSFRGNG